MIYSQGHELLDVDDSRILEDLGVIMCADLKVGSQCTEARMKANRMLGLIKRTSVVRSTETMINLYQIMVKPHLEYCVSAWPPHYIKD